MCTLTYISVFFPLLLWTICLFLTTVKYILQGSVKHFHCDIQIRPKHPTLLCSFRLQMLVHVLRVQGRGTESPTGVDI